MAAMDTRSIQKQKLSIGFHTNAQDTIPGCVGFGADADDLLTNEGIQQGTFPGIRSTHDGTISTALCHIKTSILPILHIQGDPLGWQHALPGADWQGKFLHFP
jgi:hypothetical protein